MASMTMTASEMAFLEELLRDAAMAKDGTKFGTPAWNTLDLIEQKIRNRSTVVTMSANAARGRETGA